MLSFSEIRKNIYLKIYDVKKPFILFIDVVSIVCIISGIILLGGFIGYDKSKQLMMYYNDLTYIFLNVFALRFVVKLFFNIISYEEYLKKNWIELIVTLIVSFHNIDLLFFGKDWLLTFLDLIYSLSDVYIFTVLFVLFSIISIRILYNFDFKIWWIKLNPAALLSLSFIFLILTGTVLLKLPHMTVNHYISITDALFTSTSACCVTGLVVQDTATYFTLKGQIIILILIQLGGFNMLTIAAFIGSLYRKKNLLSSTKIVSDLMDTENTKGLVTIIRKVVFYTLFIEFVGAILIYFSWGSDVFHSFKDRLFFSIFHALSAFNNAGFSLFSNGLFEQSVQHHYVLQLIIAALIILGGLGFLVLQDMFSFENIRERKRKPWKKYNVHTRLVLRVTLLLIVLGAILFFALENGKSVKDYPWYGKLVASFFHSVTLRTAGFNTVDIAQLSAPVLIFSMILMFIGASPGSTGGGIKTTTIAVAIKATIDNLRGKEHVELFNRTIPWKSVNKTYAILMISFIVLIVFTTALSITESDFTLDKIVFEAVSAMGTVGLSMGITADLSEAGKILIIILMYIGRLGSLTLGLALSQKVIYKNYRYPKTHLLIG